MSPDRVSIALIQTACQSDVAANRAQACAKIREAAAQGAQIICLQELFATRYFCQTEAYEAFDYAEAIPGPSTTVMQELARELEVVIVASLFEIRARGLYHNTAAVIDADGSYLGKYRKMHIPDDPGFYEKFYFTPGDLGYKVFKTRYATIGVLICWDQWYPEAARLMALAGADILIYPTAIGWESTDSVDEKERQLNAWMISQRGHAVANGLPVISVNRTGFEADPSGATSGITFWGNSFVAGPQGEIIHRFSVDQEETKVVTINLSRSEDVRRIWPFLRDRRIDAYDDILKRFRD